MSTLNRRETSLAFVEFCVHSDTDECICPEFQQGTEYPTLKVNDKYLKIGCVVLERVSGPRPDLTYVMRHVICGHTRCCNPKHLKWGTEKENAADRKVHGTEYDKSGENNPRAKITNKQKEEIKRRAVKGRGWYDTGNVAELAKEYGITRARISQILREK